MIKCGFPTLYCSRGVSLVVFAHDSGGFTFQIAPNWQFCIIEQSSNFQDFSLRKVLCRTRRSCFYHQLADFSFEC